MPWVADGGESFRIWIAYRKFSLGGLPLSREMARFSQMSPNSVDAVNGTPFAPVSGALIADP